MGKKHFTEEQIALALRRAESGTSVAEVIRKLGFNRLAFPKSDFGLRKIHVSIFANAITTTPFSQRKRLRIENSIWIHGLVSLSQPIRETVEASP
jgi:putative transposase